MIPQAEGERDRREAALQTQKIVDYWKLRAGDWLLSGAAWILLCTLFSFVAATAGAYWAMSDMIKTFAEDEARKQVKLVLDEMSRQPGGIEQMSERIRKSIGELAAAQSRLDNEIGGQEEIVRHFKKRHDDTLIRLNEAIKAVEALAESAVRAKKDAQSLNERIEKDPNTLSALSMLVSTLQENPNNPDRAAKALISQFTVVTSQLRTDVDLLQARVGDVNTVALKQGFDRLMGDMDWNALRHFKYHTEGGEIITTSTRIGAARLELRQAGEKGDHLLVLSPSGGFIPKLSNGDRNPRPGHPMNGLLEVTYDRGHRAVYGNFYEGKFEP